MLGDTLQAAKTEPNFDTVRNVWVKTPIDTINDMKARTLMGRLATH